MTYQKSFKQYVGTNGDDAAAEKLKAEGFKILKRNFAIHNVGEIDIIAEKDGDIHICEVRTRLNIGYYPDSAESVTASKRKKVMRTTEFYLTNENIADKNVVFDVIKVTHDKQGNVLSVEILPF